jgi:RNA polymerase sigma factor (TIGR02999 family)
VTTLAPRLQAALAAARAGGPHSLDGLVELLYPELRRLARAQLRRLRPGQTIDTTSLVHEAYLKMLGSDGYADRHHFLAAAARVMRHVLINAVRRKMAVKHGAGHDAQPLDEREVADQRGWQEELLAIGQALDRLGELDERLCRVVECRFFAGMTEEETASALAVTDRTVRRDWQRARAWLKVELGQLSLPGAEGGG